MTAQRTTSAPASGRRSPGAWAYRGAIVLFALALAGWVGSSRFILTADVDLQIVRHEMRRGKQAAFNVPLPLPWPGGIVAETFEEGRSLGSVHVASQRLGFTRFAQVSLESSDGSDARSNGRTYSIRYPLSQQPSAWALMLLGWSVLFFSGRALFRSSGHWGARQVRPEECGAVVAIGALSTYLVTARPMASTTWLLGAVLAGAALTASGTRGGGLRRAIPAWTIWGLALVLWAGSRGLGGAVSLPSAENGRVVISALVGMIVIGVTARRLEGGAALARVASAGLLVGVAVALARDSGLLAAISASWEGAPVRAPAAYHSWTTKVAGSWLVVLGWPMLGAVDAHDRGGRRTAFLGIAWTTALVSNGSLTAWVGLACSGIVWLSALVRPTLTRRLVVVTVAVGILAAPLLAPVPWATLKEQSTAPVAGSLVRRAGLDVRAGVWSLSRDLLERRPVVGWGLGSTEQSPLRTSALLDVLAEGPAVVSRSLRLAPAMPGGHPHDAALQIWLDLGLIGAVLLAGLVLGIGRSLESLEGTRRIHGAALAQLVGIASILAFNYPLWSPEILTLLAGTAFVAGLTRPRDGRRFRATGFRWVVAPGIVVLLGLGFLAWEAMQRSLEIHRLRQRVVSLDERGDRLIRGSHRIDLLDAEEVETRLACVAEAPDRYRLVGAVFDPETGAPPSPTWVFLGSALAGVVWPGDPSPELLRTTRHRDPDVALAGFEIPLDPGVVPIGLRPYFVFERGSRRFASHLEPLESCGTEAPAATGASAGARDRRARPALEGGSTA